MLIRSVLPSQHVTHLLCCVNVDRSPVSAAYTLPAHLLFCNCWPSCGVASTANSRSTGLNQVTKHLAQSSMCKISMVAYILCLICDFAMDSYVLLCKTCNVHTNAVHCFTSPWSPFTVASRDAPGPDAMEETKRRSMEGGPRKLLRSCCCCRSCWAV